MSAYHDVNDLTVAGNEPHGAGPLVDATVQEFAAVVEPGAEPILGAPGQVVMPEAGETMIVGDAGTGKSTLEIDGAFHLAAGDDWLGIHVPKPRRVLIIENEGPRPQLRGKVQRKLAAWQGSPIGDRLRIIESPWGGNRFNNPELRSTLAALIEARGYEVVFFGPLMDSGMDEAGTSQQVRAFCALLQDVRRASGTRVAFVPLHHENVAGEVSGRWKEAVETVIHVKGRGHGQTHVKFTKARWASDWHGKSLDLEWAPGESYTVSDRVEVTAEQMSDQILAFIHENPGTAWGVVEQSTPGMRAVERRSVRDALFAAGLLVNLSKGRLLDHAEKGKPTCLYAASDASLLQLRPERDEVGTKLDLAGVDGGLRVPRPLVPHVGTRDAGRSSTPREDDFETDCW